MSTKELCIMSRKKITLLYAKRYKKAKRKRDKSRILDEFVNLTSYNRNYASWLLEAVKKSVSCALIIVESLLKNSIEEMFNFGHKRYCFTPSTSV